MKKIFFPIVLFVLSCSLHAQNIYVYLEGLDMTFVADGYNYDPQNPLCVDLVEAELLEGYILPEYPSGDFMKKDKVIKGTFEKHHPDPHNSTVTRVRCKVSEETCMTIFVNHVVGEQEVCDPSGSSVTVLLNDGQHTAISASASEIVDNNLVLSGTISFYTDDENGQILDDWINGTYGMKAWPPFADGPEPVNTYYKRGTFVRNDIDWINEETFDVVTVCDVDPSDYCYFYQF